MAKLAINGGTPVRTKPFPTWPVWDERDLAALRGALESGKWFMGPNKEKFEQRWADFCNARFAVATTNGTAALAVAYRAVGIEPGDEVIIPPYTFIATATAVLEVDAIPVFADISLDTANISADAVEAVITERTAAIVPVHVAGNPADMDRINAIADKRGIAVVEDAAQAHGAEWQGRRVGAIGDAGCFSFQASKNLNAGEGGCVVTNDPQIADRAWSIHNVGRIRGGVWYEHKTLGGNERMIEWQAALLLSQMDRLEEQMQRRDQAAARLDERLSQIEGLHPQKMAPGATRSAHHLYIFRYVAEEFGGPPRARFLEALNAEGIPGRLGYNPLYREPLFADTIPNNPKLLACGSRADDMDYSTVECPNAERLTKEAVWFTQSVLLGTPEDMDDIADAILKIKENVDEL